MLAVGTDISELVQAQTALRESEERFRALADQSPFLIWVTDAAGDVEFVNRTYLEFFDVSEEDIAGTGWTPLVHPDDSERYVGEFLAATREQRPFACEARVRSASGDWRWIDSHGVPRFSSSGEFLGMVGSSPDVTDRKRIEQALRENEALLRTVLDHSRDGINMLDLKTGRYVFMNPAQVLLTGFTTEEVNGVSASEAAERVHPDDRELSVAQQQRVAAGEEVDEPVEYRWRVKSGEYRWFSDRRKIVRDEKGDPVALVGISRDITEQKRTETALRESQARLQIATEAAALGVHDFDVGAGTIAWDGRVREIWGVDPDAAVTYETFIRGLHPEDRAAAQAAVDAAVDPAGDGRYRVTFRVQNQKDGSTRWVHATGRALFEDRSAVRLVGTVEDITQRVRIEQALRQSEVEKAAQRERSHLARELHDSVTQALFAATMKSEALTLDGALPTRSADTAEEVRRLTRGALAQMRTLLLELRADPLEEIPIQQLLRHLVEATESRVRTVIRLSVNEPATLPARAARHRLSHRPGGPEQRRPPRRGPARLGGPRRPAVRRPSGRGGRRTGVRPRHHRPQPPRPAVDARARRGGRRPVLPADERRRRHAGDRGLERRGPAGASRLTQARAG